MATGVRQLFDFPLAELHRHLEGSARTQTLYEFGCSTYASKALRDWLGSNPADHVNAFGTRALQHSAGDGEAEPGLLFRTRFPTFESFDHLAVLRQPLVAKTPGSGQRDDDTSGLTKCMALFELTRCCLTLSPTVLTRVTMEMIEDAYKDGCRLLEIRYSPLYVQSANPDAFCDLASVHNVVFEAIAAARKLCPMAIGLIGIIDRCWPVEEAEREAEFILSRRDDFVGIDLANDESRFPAGPFSHIFEKASRAGLGVTIHAAEVSISGGFENARIAVEKLGASRIGHGIGALADVSTLELLREKGVMIECCPTSNVLVTDVESYSSHPLRKFIDAGLTVSVSTDDPGLFGITLLWELRNLVDLQVLTVEEVRELNIAASRASFIPRKEIDQYFKL